MRNAAIIVLTIVAAAIAASIRADSLGARMEVTANVVSNCRLTIPPLSFGTYDPLVAHAVQPADATSTIVVSCTRNAEATVAFDLGRNGRAADDRSMSGPGNARLGYQIFRDASRSRIWATGADAVRVISSGISSPLQLTVFGRITPRQEVEPGAYIDVLTATVDF